MSEKTDDIVERLRELLSNATPAQWFIVPYGDGDSLVVHSDDEKRVFFPPVPVGYSASPGSTGDPAQIKADVELIVAARNCLPALLDEIERLRSSPDRAAQQERIIAYKNHPGLPGRWRARQIRYGAFALEAELPCINGLSAWFSIATFHAAEDQERMMTDGARLEAVEYAQRFSEVPDRAAVVEECARVAEKTQTGNSYENDMTARYIAHRIRALSPKGADHG